MNKVRTAILMLTLTGLVCMGFGVRSLINTIRFTRHAQHTNGVVIENVERQEMVDDGEGKHHLATYFYPRFRFQTASGQPVEVLLDTGSNPPSYHPGARVEVLYDPDSPAIASLKDWSLWFSSGVLLGLGTIAASIGVAVYIFHIRKKRKDSWLLNHGARILADFSSVERGAIIKTDSPDPWHIVCQWLDPQTNKIHLFHSDSISFDPTAFAKDRQIPVTLDPQNFKRYSVDLSFLPLVAENHGFSWISLTSWFQRKLETYRAGWKAITGASLDANLVAFYHLCMVGLLLLDGALSEKRQLLLTGILLFGIVQFSLWQRRALRWRWSGPPTGLVRSLLFLGGIGLLFFIGFAFLVPVTHPAYLPWYLAVAGLLAFNVLSAMHIVSLTREEFRQSCRNTSASPQSASASPGEVKWKQLARTAYQVAFVAVWLATVAYFYLYGLAIYMASHPTAYLAKLSTRHQALLLTPLSQHFLDVLRTTLYVAFPSVILAACLLQFALDVPLFLDREPIPPRTDSTLDDPAASGQATSDSATHPSQLTT